MNIEKKNTRLVYDRSGTRYWCIPTSLTTEETNSDSEKSSSTKVLKSPSEFHCEHPEESLPFETCLSELKSILEESAEFIENNVNPGPHFQHTVTKEFSSKLLTCTLEGELRLTKFGEEVGKVFEKQGSPVHQSDSSTSPKNNFNSKANSQVKEITNLPNADQESSFGELDDKSFLWKPQSLREERGLSLEYWKALSLKEKKAVLKIDGDLKSFFSGHTSKTNSKSTKTLTPLVNKQNCNCIECDPRRAFMQIQFEAFYIRYKMAQNNDPTLTENLISSPDRIFKEAVETTFFDGSLDELKNKIFKMAQKLIKKDGKEYIEISNQLVYDHQKLIKVQETPNSSNTVSLFNETTASLKNKLEGEHYFCTVHSKAVEHLGFPQFCAELGSGKAVACTGKCGHTTLTSMAFSMFGMGPSFNTNPLDLEKASAGILLKDPNAPADRAPFPAANPPEDLAPPKKIECADKDCTFDRFIANMKKLMEARSSESASSVSPEETFKMALKNSIDDDVLVKVYVAKLFDHRILIFYREMLAHQRQIRLIEEIEFEEKKKAPQIPKKGKKKVPKSSKKFEEELARKKREAELEKQAELDRKAAEKKEVERRKQEEAELLAEIQKARALNRQAKEEAERGRKGSKCEGQKGTRHRPTEASSNGSLSHTHKTNTFELSVSSKSSYNDPSRLKASKSTTPEPASSISKTSSVPRLHKEPVKPLLTKKLDKSSVSSENETVKESTTPDHSSTASKNTLKTKASVNVKSSISPFVPTIKTARSSVGSGSTYAQQAQKGLSPVPKAPTSLSPSESPSPFLSNSINVNSPSQQQLQPHSQYGFQTYASPYNYSQGVPPMAGYPQSFVNSMSVSTESSFSNISLSSETGYIQGYPHPPGLSSGYYSPYPPQHGYPMFPGHNLTNQSQGWVAPEGSPFSVLPFSQPGPELLDNQVFNSTTGFIEPLPMNELVPSGEPRAPSFTQSAQQVQENARHAYFSLLMDMGMGLSTLPEDRPFVSLTQLYDKYIGLFSAKAMSIGSFYQLCSLSTKDPPTAMMSPVHSPPVNQFQFQPDMEQPYPRIRHYGPLQGMGLGAPSYPFYPTINPGLRRPSELTPITLGELGPYHSSSPRSEPISDMFPLSSAVFLEGAGFTPKDDLFGPSPFSKNSVGSNMNRLTESLQTQANHALVDAITYEP